MNHDDLVAVGQRAIRSRRAPELLDLPSTHVLLDAVATMVISAIRDFDTVVAEQFVANLRRVLAAPADRQATLRRWPGLSVVPPARSSEAILEEPAPTQPDEDDGA